MLRPCQQCGANVLHNEKHDEFHITVRDLEERVSVLENRLDEMSSVLLLETRG